jgi:hypothetical protein
MLHSSANPNSADLSAIPARDALEYFPARMPESILAFSLKARTPYFYFSKAVMRCKFRLRIMKFQTSLIKTAECG